MISPQGDIGASDATGQRKPIRTSGIERLLTLAWSGLENSCRQFLSLGFFFVSVRFLLPSDLGVFALALALNAVSQIFIDEAIGESLVQKADVTPADWNTGFTVNLIVATGFLILSLVISWPIARLLGEPALMYAVPALGVASLAGAFGNIQKAFLGRALRFRLIAQTTLTGQVIGGGVAIALAVSGFGYWALIANVAISAAVCSMIYWRRSPWKPRLQITRATLDSRLSYAAYSVAIRCIYLLRDQSPLIIAGFLVDLTHVGFLSLALRVARSLGLLFEEVTTRPLLSLISREQHDIDRFGEVLAEVMTIVGALALPGYIGLALVGPRLLPLAFGPTWAPAGALLPWVCGVLGSWLLLHIVAVSLRARSLGRVAVKLTAPAAVLDVVVLAALAPFGLKWALMGWMARSVLSIPIAIGVLQSRLGVPIQVLAQRSVVTIFASVLMGSVLAYWDHVEILGTGLASAGLEVAVGCLTYGVSIVIAMPSLRRRLIYRCVVS